MGKLLTLRLSKNSVQEYEENVRRNRAHNLHENVEARVNTKLHDDQQKDSIHK